MFKLEHYSSHLLFANTVNEDVVNIKRDLRDVGGCNRNVIGGTSSSQLKANKLSSGCESDVNKHLYLFHFLR